MKNIRPQDYKVEIMKDKNGEGYFAHILQLDCWGDGDTPKKAYCDAISVAEDIIDMAKKDNREIPLPLKDNLE